MSNEADKTNLPPDAKTLEQILHNYQMGSLNYLIAEYNEQAEEMQMSIQMQQGQLIDLANNILKQLEPGARAMIVHETLLDVGTAMHFAAGVGRMMHAPDPASEEATPAPGSATTQ